MCQVWMKLELGAGGGDFESLYSTTEVFFLQDMLMLSTERKPVQQNKSGIKIVESITPPTFMQLLPGD